MDDTPRHIVTATYYSNNKNIYYNPINDRIQEGIEAMQSLLEFVKSHYGNMMHHRVKSVRLVDDKHLNKKIDSLLNINQINYKNIV